MGDPGVQVRVLWIHDLEMSEASDESLVIEYMAPARAATFAAPSPVIEHVALLSCHHLYSAFSSDRMRDTCANDFCAVRARVIEYVAPTPVIEHIAPPPAV